MSQDDSVRTERSLWGTGFNLYLAAWVLTPIIVLGILLFLLVFGRPSERPDTKTNGTRTAAEENHLARVRSTLAKQTDLTACRTVVEQLNVHLQQAGAAGVPALSQGDIDRLKSELGLTDDALEEVKSPTFTPLDAHHLEACFLFRDAARWLEVTVGGTTGKPTPLDRAEAGFAWVVRQMRLSAPGEPIDTETPPPVPVLRRGHGTPLERALAFLALLEQFGLEQNDAAGLQGCLVYCPDDKGNQRLWACGVARGGDLHLFDPRLGLAIPGPGGKGIATLAQAREDAGVLGQLQVDKLRYDVTPAQAKQATFRLVCPLSAVAPRMRLLQDHLLLDSSWKDQALPVAVRVRLAEEPARALSSVRAAVKSGGGKPEDVRFLPEGANLLRRFLPKEEGGTDTGRPFDLRQLKGFVAENDAGPPVLMQRQKLFHFQAVPWQGLPRYFLDPNHFRWDFGIGQQIRTIYATPFLRPILEPNSPRDLILRGRPQQAVPQLVEERRQWQQMRVRLREASDLGPGVKEWVSNVTAAQADVLRQQGQPGEEAARARLGLLWKWKLGDPIEVLLNGVIAGPAGAQAMYQLALARHEQAARYQARVDLGARGGVTLPTDTVNARKTWADAADYWREFIANNPGRPGIASAQRLRGEAQARLGEAEAAAETWKETSAPMSELEKLACLWLTRQAAKGK